ncbi:MAG: cob(I)yrinic acid a,c-diamide adenosyltransferase [Bacteroidetes bacterium]|jgi:cob(I)alamin adenosyltransferase|nr:cob(I)yrinic acid a,c-diamide adenosyltransferase [Bacteroidota bacterium]
MKIYTRKGDTGHTGLLGGTRVPKWHLRIESYGTVDELNSWLGLLGSLPEGQPQLAQLRRIQDRLFTLGSHLAADPEKNQFALPQIQEADIAELEAGIDLMEADLPALKNFVLPGGSAANAQAHIARCVCRRAERMTAALHAESPVEPVILKYLNRLSDWLFVFARWLSLQAQSEEVVWKPRQD